MPYTCINPERYLNRSIGTGQCVAFVQECAAVPHTSMWRPGLKVLGNLSLPKGVAIATFRDGQYPNHSSGNHAAIYLGQSASGIQVLDQWMSHGIPRPVQERTIRSKGGIGTMSDDAEFYFVIE